jgi:hypothetical protein
MWGEIRRCKIEPRMTNANAWGCRCRSQPSHCTELSCGRGCHACALARLRLLMLLVECTAVGEAGEKRSRNGTSTQERGKAEERGFQELIMTLDSTRACRAWRSWSLPNQAPIERNARSPNSLTTEGGVSVNHPCRPTTTPTLSSATDAAIDVVYARSRITSNTVILSDCRTRMTVSATAEERSNTPRADICAEGQSSTPI